MKKLKYKLILLFIPILSLILRILGRTIRWKKRYEFTQDKGKIYALWHGHSLGLALYAMDRGIVVLVSRYRDGEIAARILHELGFKTVRGSSEEGLRKEQKGGRRAVLELIELLKKGENVAITVDGPKGPPKRVKEGVVFLSQKTGSPILPVAVKFERYLRLKTWDNLIIPHPFTKGEVIIGKEVRVSPDEDLEHARKRLESVLNELSSVS